MGLLFSGGGLNPFVGGLVEAFMQQGKQDEHLCKLRNEYREQRDSLCRALRRHLPPDATFVVPGVSAFVPYLSPGLETVTS
jgi:DNA-binding transcriptional MocR family regulator